MVKDYKTLKIVISVIGILLLIIGIIMIIIGFSSFSSWSIMIFRLSGLMVVIGFVLTSIIIVVLFQNIMQQKHRLLLK